MLVTVAQAGPLRVWDTQTWAELETLEGPPGLEERRVALNRDGTRLLSSAGLELVVHDATNGAALRRIEHGQPVLALGVSADGQSLASAGADGLRLWTGEGDAAHHVQVGSKTATSIAYSAAGTVLASGWDDGKIRMIDVARGKVEATIRVGRRIEDFALSGSGSRLAVLTGADELAVLEIGRTKPVATIAHARPLGLDAGGNLLLAARLGEGEGGGEQGDRVEIIDVVPAEPVRSYGHEQVRVGRFSPNGLIFATAGADSSVLIWVAP